jgi:hypothetical protein
MKVMPVTIGALPPTKDTLASLTWRDPAQPIWRRFSMAARAVPHPKGDPGEFGGCRGPERAIADGGYPIAVISRTAIGD